MSKFHATTHVPAWRLFAYGFLALAVAGWLGYHFDDRGLFRGAAIAVPSLIVLLLTAFHFGRSQAARRHRGTLIWLYLISQAAIALWALLSYRQHP